MESQIYDSYPKATVLLSILFSLATYFLGIFILAGFGFGWVILYILYCLWLEYRLLKKGCVNCYYYGKRCGLGKGVMCAWFFKQGQDENLKNAPFTWKDLLPDLMVTLIPLVFGVVALIRNFSWIIVLSMAALLLLASAGNAYVRGNLLCPHCKQKEIGCPAERLFNSSNR